MPTSAEIEKALGRLRTTIADYGLLLLHDPLLFCATQLIAGAPVKGSWWGAPSGALAYEAFNRLDNDEVAWPKLLGGKLTLVHRRLWPALVAVARSGAPWQTRGLEPDSRALLARLEKAGKLRSDEIELPRGSRKIGVLVTELEARLLAYCEQEHTGSGHHARLVVPYAVWQRQKRIFARTLPPLETAIEDLSEAAVRSLGERALGRFLPWQEARKARPRARTGVRSRLR
ncbi:MAG TPA: hypothetical protein VM686_29845 [Polyangiaceae bacterium]|jgi:hypothetical protein|nr:hypothetical protein [Polyangiaceae bacterium]